LTPRLEAAAKALGDSIGEDDAAALLEAVVGRLLRRKTQHFQVEVHTAGGRVREASIHPPEPILTAKGA
jgi:hypothetical protein